MDGEIKSLEYHAGNKQRNKQLRVEYFPPRCSTQTQTEPCGSGRETGFAAGALLHCVMRTLNLIIITNGIA